MAGLKRSLPPLALVAAVIVATGIALTCGVHAAKAPAYDISVSFDETATQDDIDWTEAILRPYDSGVSYLVQESFPPTGRATLRTKALGFCPEVERRLKTIHGVRNASCTLAGAQAGGSPQAP